MADLETMLAPHLLALHPDDNTPTSRWSSSDAGSCWRQRWYVSRRTPRDDYELCAQSARSILVTEQGRWLHDELQEAMVRAGDGAVHADVVWQDDDLGLAVHADLAIDRPAFGLTSEQTPAVGRIVVTSGYGFRLAGRAAEPEERHVLGAMQAAAVQDGKGALVIYVSRDGGQLASWWLPLDDERRRQVDEERRRIARLDVQETVPRRTIPGRGVVGDPSALVKFWQCRYCAWRDQCTKDGA